MSLNLGIALEISAVPFINEEIEEKKFICHECHRAFSGIGFLKAHFQRAHPNSQFQSPTTDKSSSLMKFKSKSKIFKSKSSIESSSSRTNLSLFAESSEPLKCKKCMKSFSKRFDLLTHQYVHGFNSHLGVFSNDFTKFSSNTQPSCDTCKKILRRFMDHKEHVSVKCELCSSMHCKDWLYLKEMCNNNGECTICVRELCEKCHKLHRSEPTKKEKSHECVVCQEVFKDKRSLKDHYVNVHALAKVSY